MRRKGRRAAGQKARRRDEEKEEKGRGLRRDEGGKEAVDDRRQ